jgi:hypothetical protein
MSRLFDVALEESLEIDQAVVTTYPFVMACMAYVSDNTIHSTFMGLADKDAPAEYFRLHSYPAGSGQTFVANTRTAAEGSNNAVTSTQWSLNTWHHACGLWVSATDRRVFIDGGSKGTDVVNLTPAGIDRTAIGVIGDSSPSGWMDGMIAEAAIWDLTSWPGATASDKADAFEKILPSLAKRFSPLFYPLGLKAYWPLVRGLNDKVGGYNLTASGTVVSAHSKVILPHTSL